MFFFLFVWHFCPAKIRHNTVVTLRAGGFVTSVFRLPARGENAIRRIVKCMDDYPHEY